jgi:hypothetical protein
MKIIFSERTGGLLAVGRTLKGALLVTGLISNVPVFGQVKRSDSLHFPRPEFRLAPVEPGYIHPPMIINQDQARKLASPRIRAYHSDSIRILSPDRMPCLVTDLSRMEGMPVQRKRNLEPMPNGVGDGRPRLRIAPRKRDLEPMPKRNLKPMPNRNLEPMPNRH